MYTTKPDEAIWSDFGTAYPHLLPWVSRTTFMKHKPFWLRNHKWYGLLLFSGVLRAWRRCVF